MNSTLPPLFLPTTEQLVLSMIQQPEESPASLEGLSIAELSAIYIIQGLPNLPSDLRSTVAIEKKLAEIIDIALEIDKTEEKSDFKTIMSQRLNTTDLSAGLQQLQSLNIRLIDANTLESKIYLTRENRWNFNFNTAHAEEINPYKEPVTLQNGKTISLTSQQYRLHSVIQAGLDEHLNIQALAGTGKTFLTTTIIETLEKFNPLILAFTGNQINRLKERINNKKIRALNYKDFAQWLLSRCPVNRIIHEERSLPRYQVSPDTLAERLGISSLQNLSPAQVADICSNMVKSFCYGSSPMITTDHVPKYRKYLSSPDKERLVQYAQMIWKQTAYPSDTYFQLPLRVYHILKQLSLEPDVFLSRTYTHIIIDEAQDIPAPLAQFLDRCQQPVITLGDACQNTEARTLKRNGTVHQREMNHSIRAGKQLEDVINTLIDKNPIVHVNRLEGSKDHDTKIVYYDKASVPDEPVTILVNSEWGMFEWFQRLAMADAKFTILAASKASFDKFAEGCINLFHKNKRSYHGALFRFTDWQSAKHEMHEDPSFISIDRMLSKGYSLEDLRKSQAKLDNSGHAPIKIGRAFDAKNMEIDTVMLAPDLLEKIEPNDPIQIAKTFSALYIAGTRARSKLIVPGHLKDWATDLTSSTAQKPKPVEQIRRTAHPLAHQTGLPKEPDK